MTQVQKVLVTGGAGFIGSNFILQTLQLKSDVEIVVLDKLTYAGSLSRLESAVDRIKFVKGDVCNAELVEELIAKVDLVVHFAAESHNDNSLDNPDIFIETNVLGTLNIVKSCASNNVRLHHVSTDEVFGDLPIESNDQFMTSSPYAPSSPYSASKAASDHLVRAWSRSFGLKATISNCSNNYGPMQHWEKLIPHTIKRLASGKNAQIFGSGHNVRDWIHVNDHIAGIWLAIDQGLLGATYLLGARDTVDNLTIVRAILSELGLPESRIEFVADRPGHDLKYAIDPSSAEVELGWEPRHRSVICHMPHIVKWYKTQLKIEGKNAS